MRGRQRFNFAIRMPTGEKKCAIGHFGKQHDENNKGGGEGGGEGGGGAFAKPTDWRRNSVPHSFGTAVRFPFSETELNRPERAALSPKSETNPFPPFFFQPDLGKARDFNPGEALAGGRRGLLGESLPPRLRASLTRASPSVPTGNVLIIPFATRTSQRCSECSTA